MTVTKVCYVKYAKNPEIAARLTHLHVILPFIGVGHYCIKLRMSYPKLYVMQNFLAFRDSPTIPLRRSPIFSLLSPFPSGSRQNLLMELAARGKEWPAKLKKSQRSQVWLRLVLRPCSRWKWNILCISSCHASATKILGAHSRLFAIMYQSVQFSAFS